MLKRLKKIKYSKVIHTYETLYEKVIKNIETKIFFGVIGNVKDLNLGKGFLDKHYDYTAQHQLNEIINFCTKKLYYITFYNIQIKPEKVLFFRTGTQSHAIVDIYSFFLLFYLFI